MELIKEAIADAGESAEYVFLSKDGEGPLSPLVVAKTVLRAQKVHEERPHGRFGIPHWTAHDLRRTALTNFAALGISPVVAGAVANHVSVTKATITLAVYTQYIYEKEKREGEGDGAVGRAVAAGGVNATAGKKHGRNGLKTGGQLHEQIPETPSHSAR